MVVVVTAVVAVVEEEGGAHRAVWRRNERGEGGGNEVKNGEKRM